MLTYIEQGERFKPKEGVCYNRNTKESRIVYILPKTGS